MFHISLAQPSFSLFYIGDRVIGTVNLVNQATFVLLSCFVFWGHKRVADGVHRFGVDHMLSDGSF